jgi:hypothetical protein
VGIGAPLIVAKRFQSIDSSRNSLAWLASAVQEDSAESFMIRRKAWLHYRAIRLSLEILATLGSAALIGYWIVLTSR